MKKIDGWYLPDNETFFDTRIQKSCDPKYERKERTNIWKHLLHTNNRKRTAIDIGCNIGIWSNFLSTFFTQVHSFDPSPDIKECFQKNVLDRKNNVNFYDCGLGNLEHNTLLNLSKNNSGGSSIVRKFQHYNSVEIDVKKLDSFLFDNIDFIKIDTEGYEINVLEGAVNTIKNNLPLVYIEKQEDTNIKLLEEFMNDNRGYKIHDWLRNEIWSFNPDDKDFKTKFGNYKIFKREYNRIMKERNSDIS